MHLNLISHLSHLRYHLLIAPFHGSHHCSTRLGVNETVRNLGKMWRDYWCRRGRISRSLGSLWGRHSAGRGFPYVLSLTSNLVPQQSHETQVGIMSKVNQWNGTRAHSSTQYRSSLSPFPRPYDDSNLCNVSQLKRRANVSLGPCQDPNLGIGIK